MAAPLCPDAGPVLDRASDLPADHAGPVRQRPSYTAQQDQVGVWETHQSGAGRGRPHQEGGSDQSQGGCEGKKKNWSLGECMLGVEKVF